MKISYAERIAKNIQQQRLMCDAYTRAWVWHKEDEKGFEGKSRNGIILLSIERNGFNFIV